MAGTEDLERSLRREVDEQLDARLRPRLEEIQRLHAQLGKMLSGLAEEVQSSDDDKDSLVLSISEHLRQARSHGMEEAAEAVRTRSTSDAALIKAAVDELNEQRTQADALNSLINRSASFAPRVAFFVVKNERATGWRARGLEGTVGDDAVRDISLPLDANTVLSEAYHTRSTWSGTPGSKQDDHQLLSKIGGEPPQRMVTVPLLVRDKCVAVLYADSAGLESDAINLEALETLVRITGMVVELLAARRGTATSATGPTSQPTAAGRAPVEPAAAPAPPPAIKSTDSHARAESHAHAEAAPAADVFAPQTAPSPGEGSSTPQSVAAAPFDATPAVPEAPAPVPPPALASPSPADGPQAAAPLGTRRRFGQDAELPVQVAAEERPFHYDARSFARLLVSEIKLYNEQKVADGRAQGNLYERLREEIDRSRQMYDKRVHPSVAPRYDYFHQELVRTLAGGDPAKLGAAYPGTTVPA